MAILTSNQGRVNIPTGPFLDARGNINPAWQIWLLNPNVQSLQAAAPLDPYSGGLGVSTTPAIGQMPVATSTGVYVPTPFSSMPVFTSTSAGLAPASGGGTVNFLRADGTYASPVAGSTGQVQYNSSGTFAASNLFTYDGAGLLGVSNITGTALGMTIQPKAPTTLQDIGSYNLILQGRNAEKYNTNGQTINIVSGTGYGPFSNGGDCNFYAGAATQPGLSGTGTGGRFFMQAGDSDAGLGGNLTLAGGASNSGTGGDIVLVGGYGNTGGSFSLQAGDGLSTGGNVVIQAGSNYSSQWGTVQMGASGFSGLLLSADGVGALVGFYGTAPVAQAAAYTLTYSTAARTVPNATAVAVSTTGAALGFYGYTTAAQANAIPVAINALEADVLALKKLIVSLINDNSATLGVGLNAT